MSRIIWGGFAQRTYEAGVDRGVFYPNVGPGLPWNGLVNVKEEPSGGEVKLRYVDGVPLRGKSVESFAAVLQAYTCPIEFEEYDGTSGILSQQKRKAFGLSYRTRIGNDAVGLDYAYQIHLLYNVLAMPTQMNSSTLKTDGLDAEPFSWGLSTTPLEIPGAKPAAHLIIDTRIAYPEAIEHLESVLYGAEEVEASLPTPQEVFDIVEEHSLLMIIDHGDGTWTAIGPDEAIEVFGDDTFEITWPSAVYLDADTYRISSL